MYDVVIIGAGIAGCSLICELGEYQIKAVLIEKKNDVSVGATEVGSIIIHGGYGPPPGSKMAKYNVAGNAYIKELYGKLDIPYRQVGALIMTFLGADERTLEELKNRGTQNGVEGMEIWDKERLHKEEPHVSQEVRATLYSPNVGIVSSQELALTLAEVAVGNGVEVKLNTGVRDIRETDTGYFVETNQGVIDVVCVCNMAGVFTDEVNEMVNDAAFKIKPNRREYYLLDKNQGNLVNHVIFQCPSGSEKGVLIAPTMHDNPIVGPDSQSTSREDVSIATESLNYVRNTALKPIPDINFRESIRSFAGVCTRTKEDDFFVYEDPEDRPFYNITGMASPGLSSAPIVALDVIEMIRGSGLPLTKKEACADTRSVVRFREMNHEKRTALIEEYPEYGKIICRCGTVTGGEIIDAVHRPIPAVSIDAVRRRCDAGMGHRQGGFCGPRVQEIIARELKKDLKDVPLGREGVIPIIEEARATEGEQE